MRENYSGLAEKAEEQIEQLKQRAEGIDAETEAHLRSLVDTLRTKKEEVEKRLETLDQASMDAWEKLKQDFEESYEEFKEAMKRAETH